MKQNITPLSSISILGRPIELIPIDASTLKGLTFGDRLSFNFYHGEYQKEKFAFALPIGKTPSPRILAITAKHFTETVGLTLVFVLDSAPWYLRQRLVDKGVYFIVSDKFAFLPNLLINERITEGKKPEKLTPVAQFILLYHLQVKSLNGLSALNLKELLPYSYSSITLGLVCLEDLGLIVRKIDVSKNKIINFTAKGKALFDLARQYMIDPVEYRLYCDELKSNEQFPICSINALAHFTILNPDKERMIAMSKKTLKEMVATQALVCENPYDGKVMIEVWKYPPVTTDGFDSQYVDKLSIVLSLAGDPDPRVENEVERLIDQLNWVD